MKIVVNRCYGGFGLSKEGMMHYAKIKGVRVWPESDTQYPSLGIIHYYTVPPEARVVRKEFADFYAMSMDDRQAYNAACKNQSLYDRDIPRDDAALVQVVEELGDAANGRHASLEVVEIPDDVQWQIEEYDGREWVAESHRTW